MLIVITTGGGPDPCREPPVGLLQPIQERESDRWCATRLPRVPAQGYRAGPTLPHPERVPRPRIVTTSNRPPRCSALQVRRGRNRDKQQRRSPAHTGEESGSLHPRTRDTHRWVEGWVDIRGYTHAHSRAHTHSRILAHDACQQNDDSGVRPVLRRATFGPLSRWSVLHATDASRRVSTHRITGRGQ